MQNRVTENLRNNYILYLILAFAAALRLAYLIFYSALRQWELLAVDNDFHHNWAQEIAGGNFMGNETYFRAPFYIWCLGFLYSLLGTSLWVGRLFGLAIGLASIAMTYRLSTKLFGKKIGLIAAAIQSLYPMLIYFESELLLDPLFMLLFQYAVFRIVAWIDEGTSWNLLHLSLAIGLASITRPTALILVAAMIILLIAQVSNRKHLLSNFLILAFGLITMAGPLFVRNIVVAGDPVLISSQGGINFFIGNNDDADGLSAIMPLPHGYNWKISDITHEAEIASGRKLRPGEVSTYWLDKGIDWILENPKEFVAGYSRKVYYHISNREVSNNRNLSIFFDRITILYLNPLSFGLIFSLGMIGIFFHYRKEKNVRTVVGIIALFVLSGALFFFSSRFRLPLIPMFITLAASGVYSIFSRPRIIDRTFVIVIMIFLGSSALSYLPIVSYPDSAPVIQILSQGNVSYANGRYDDAISFGREALRIEGNFPDVNLNLGAAFYRKGLADSARYYFENEIRIHPLRADAYVNIGSLFLVLGENQRAIISANKALEIRPHDLTAGLLLIRALSANRLVKTDSLLAVIASQSIFLRENIYFLNEAAGLILERRDLRAADSILGLAMASKAPAIETNDKAFERDFPYSFRRIGKERALTHYHLGLISGLRRDYAEAIVQNHKALEFDSGLVEAHINLAAGYISIGEKLSADSVLMLAEQRFPGNKLITQIRSELH